MKHTLTLGVCAFALLFSAACSKHSTGRISAKYPACLDKKLEAFLKSGGSCPKGNSVKQYLFQGKKVYVVAPGNCGADMAATVMDDQCNEIGYLGGFAGNTRINNEDFGNAVYQETVYQD
ncbi:DUF6970 domain-containing protein [Rurimicrobium arvi]|uniref:DUF6970 domain-containing protein n=1 Tax=Rurimicrobium arvi TaxID=2049916 RepID=A0ABP8MV90_9BACT